MENQFEITWDVNAGNSLKQAYKFLKANVSESYAKRFKEIVFEKVEELRHQPERHPLEPMLQHRSERFRYIAIKNWKIIYEFTGHQILILYLFNVKQNPQVLLDAFDDV